MKTAGEGGCDQQRFASRQNRAQHRKVRSETRNQPHRDKQDQAVAACARAASQSRVRKALQKVPCQK
jgi:hypothetical protein